MIKEYGIQVTIDGLLELDGKGVFTQDKIADDCTGLSREELLALYNDLKIVRGHMLCYIQDKKIAKKLSIEDAYERWAQIYTIEAVIRLIRDIANKKEISYGE
jgi:hypothetical protein